MQHAYALTDVNFVSGSVSAGPPNGSNFRTIHPRGFPLAIRFTLIRRFHDLVTSAEFADSLTTYAADRRRPRLSPAERIPHPPEAQAFEVLHVAAADRETDKPPSGWAR
jgi:hypothetical protein